MFRHHGKFRGNHQNPVPAITVFLGEGRDRTRDTADVWRKGVGQYENVHLSGILFDEHHGVHAGSYLYRLETGQTNVHFRHAIMPVSLPFDAWPLL